MCTVTFIPTHDGFYLTSNRDESRQRRRAKAPEVYSWDNAKLIYPRDADKGGSWVALKEMSTAAVLLNGAFRKHMRTPPYRISRGLVLLDIVRKPDPLEYLAGMDLHGVEPFTLVLFYDGNLWDCRWDGSQKHIHPLDRSSPYIWSSATLYDKAASNERQRWFTEWLQSTERIAPEDIVAFHQMAGNGDIRNSLVMNRDNELFTVSVTNITVSKEGARMVYHDLQTGKHTVTGFDFPIGTAADLKPEYKRKWWARFSWTFKKFRTKLTRWEFWPTHLIYAPVYPYWLWLSLRARSLFFFNAANPRIEYAGFTHERKSDIYRQLPGRYYPRTHFCPEGADFNELKKQLKNRSLDFPLIAKPDIGERGAQVSLLRTDHQLEEYSRRSKVDFLLQEYVPYPMEAGIFYVRIPGEEKGRITGIVAKEFLSVTGDGGSTMRELLLREPRYLLQLDALMERYGSLLNTVLPEGTTQTLVPYGNHCRGAKFIDCSERITAELVDVVDRICRQIPDFYYGRLDLKFTSWEDLLQEKSFSIIEVNGAGSEPTHMYDPGHSLFFAWKEIMRHWRLLYRISLTNAEQRNIPLMSTRQGWRMIIAHTRYLKMLEQL
jgi:hypothetical protein